METHAPLPPRLVHPPLLFGLKRVLQAAAGRAWAACACVRVRACVCACACRIRAQSSTPPLRRGPGSPSGASGAERVPEPASPWWQRIGPQATPPPPAVRECRPPAPFRRGLPTRPSPHWARSGRRRTEQELRGAAALATAPGRSAEAVGSGTRRKETRTRASVGRPTRPHLAGRELVRRGRGRAPPPHGVRCACRLPPS